MKKLLFVSIFATLLAGCSETSDNIVKAIAKAILANDSSSNTGSSTSGYATDTAPAQPVMTETQVAVPKPAPHPVITETPVNYTATAITLQGSRLIIRRRPSQASARVSHLEYGENLTVIAETSKCQTIRGIRGCWVKVQDYYGNSGYVFNGYLRR
ncbi:MAG: SH3 domain-containing protein [Acinetobacter sp.]|nr:SH3 domain-containing protein [Acinetobacter sp.]